MTQNRYLTFFHTLGLSEAEAALYFALLEGGPASIRQAATAAKVNRGKAYESLKRLVAIGLVSFKQQGERRRFVAESPQRITALLAEQQHSLTQVEATAQKLLPHLMALGTRRTGEPMVRFYEDDEGIVAILRDVLHTLEQSETKAYRIYSSKPLRQYLYQSFPSFTRRRIAAGIFVRAIAVGEGGEAAESSERKWLPAPTDEQLSSYVLIYDTKVAMISLSANNTPYGVVIEEPGVAATQRFLFEKLWQYLPETAEQTQDSIA